MSDEQQAERDAAVAQVAGLEDELRHVVVTLSHIAEMFPIGVAPEDLVTAMQNKCGALVARLKALASSAPLVAARDAELEKWKQAVIEACVVNCIGWDENDPIKTLADLVAWEVKVALDPKVSKEAAEIEAGALEELADDFQSVRLVCYASGEPIPDLVNALRARAQEKRKAGTQAH